MAFGFPYTLFHLKQTETTEIKAVIIVGRSGEKSPSPESYFIGEEPPKELHKIGYGELTNTGKERMYLLGKFLKLRYYHLLLNGNPRKIYARAAALDRHLESAQALLAGLNPPKDSWFWSSTNELSEWQPKAVHSTATEYDDLLSIESNCFKLEQDKISWKNSTKYQQLLNEFRHDLQTLRANTGLEFEDDLEMLSAIEDALRTRKAFKENVPAWYTSTFANRLGHIADVTTESRFNSASVQRLYVGRLLHEVAERINTKILLHQQLLANQAEAGRHEFADESLSLVKQEPQLIANPSDNAGKANTIQAADDPNIFVYITDKLRLAALMSSLQIYSSEPRFGSLLLIELHFDPINQIHFLRLFTISSSSPNSFPEPLRVNPIACMDSLECAPQQFEQNIRHLMLDKGSWQEACLANSKPSDRPTTGAPLQPLIVDDLSNQPLQESTIPSSTPSTVPVWTDAPTTISTSTAVLVPEVETSSDGYATNGEDKLEEELIVGPIKEVTPPIDVVVDMSSTAVAMNVSSQTETEPTSVAVEDFSSTTEESESSTHTSDPVEQIVAAGSDKKDITSSIEFQNSPSNSMSVAEDPRENFLDDIAGQEMLKVAEKEHFEKNYHHASDI